MKKPADLQRKTPKQSRSKVLVDAIFEATVRILPKIGSQNITTKKIADLAGISIGSLYQYFPNKESVLTGIMDMVARANMAETQKRIDAMTGKSIEESTNLMVDLALELFLEEKEKVREIYRMAPELGKLPTLLQLRQSVVERLAEVMKQHHPGQSEAEYVRVSFVAVNSVMGVIQTMLYDEKQAYTREELSAEIKIMLNAYFQKRSSSLS